VSRPETDRDTAAAATLGLDRSHARRTADRAAVDALRAGDEQAFSPLAERWLDDVNDYLHRAGVADEEAPATLERIFRTARARIDEQDRGTESGFGSIVMGATIAEVGAAPVHSNSDLTPSRRTVGRLSRGTRPADLAGDPIIVMMLWDAAGVLGDRVAEIMDLHWRHGLDSGEIAGIVGLDRNRVDAILSKAPQGLASALRTRVLWAAGTPEHDQLAHLVAAAGASTFDGEAVRLMHRHIRECAACRSRSMIALPAIDVFAAIPLERAAPARRQAVYAAVGAVKPPLDRSARAEAEPEGAPDEARLEQRAPAAPPVNPGDPAPAAFVVAASDALANVEETSVVETSGPERADASPGPAGPSRRARRTRSKRLLIAAVAAGVVLVLIAAFALTRSSNDDATELDVAAAPGTERPTTTQAPTTTAAPAEEAGEEQVDPEPEAGPDPEPSFDFPEAAPAPGPAPAPIIPSGDGAPPTTQPLGLQVTFNITSPLGGGRVVRNYEMGQVKLNWSADAARPITVEVTGPFNGPGNAVRTSPTGNVDLCPGATTGSVCTAPLGSYYYTIKVFENGLYVFETTAVLCIATSDTPSCF
jgi:hypothetical protein